MRQVIRTTLEQLKATSDDLDSALLAWLALHPGEHPRGPLAGLLFPGVPQAHARASLRSAAWAVRRMLGPDEREVHDGRETIGLRASTGLCIACTVPNDGLEEVQAADVTQSATAYATVDEFRAGGDAKRASLGASNN